MIGIVAVSHSAALGEAVLELALQMVHRSGVRVQVAAGAGNDVDGTPVLGTDAVAVAGAIDDLATDCDGVLVLMDLGSAVLSAELALELRTSDVAVRLAAAPFVEGMLAAVVSAAGGGDLDAVAAEAAAALGAKAAQLGESELSPASSPPASETVSEGAALTRVVTVRNTFGIHARPAALIAKAASGAQVRLRRLPDGPEVSAASLTGLLVLGARQGASIEIASTGADAADALERVAVLFEDGFGESVEVVTDTAPSAPPGAPIADSTSPARAIGPGETVRGRGVSPGSAAAQVVFLGVPLAEPGSSVVVAAEDRDAEASTIEWASVAVAEDLRSRAERATGEARDILDASGLIAADPELVAEATALVRSAGRSAARAVWETALAHEQGLRALGGRMAERAADIRDVRDRIIAEILQIDVPGVTDIEEPFVLVATDLSPADTAALAGGRCVALVTEQGGPTSHTAIIARSLGIPAVVAAAGATGIAEGEMVLVDGDRGIVEVAPAPSRVAAAVAASIIVPFSGSGALSDGSAVPLLANVGSAADAIAAAEAGAEGIGLFRTEFCFLDRVEAPSIDEQIAAYRGVLAAFPGRRVVVRTLDAGSDKPLPFANDRHEENPALGVRGLRLTRRDPVLLDDQLRALAAAAHQESARVEVMAPMVATVEEAADFAGRARAAGLARVGIMIETPAAALLAEELCEVVDFVSLGTNDLAQYTLAADRLVGDLGDLNDPWQPAVLRLIGVVGAAGRSSGTPVGVCGEAAADPTLAPVLVGLGATSLSMGSRALGRVAAALERVGADACTDAAYEVLQAATVEEARSAARRFIASP